MSRRQKNEMDPLAKLLASLKPTSPVSDSPQQVAMRVFELNKADRLNRILIQHPEESLPQPGSLPSSLTELFVSVARHVKLRNDLLLRDHNPSRVFDEQAMQPLAIIEKCELALATPELYTADGNTEMEAHIASARAKVKKLQSQASRVARFSKEAGREPLQTTASISPWLLSYIRLWLAIADCPLSQSDLSIVSEFIWDNLSTPIMSLELQANPLAGWTLMDLVVYYGSGALVNLLGQLLVKIGQAPPECVDSLTKVVSPPESSLLQFAANKHKGSCLLARIRGLPERERLRLVDDFIRNGLLPVEQLCWLKYGCDDADTLASFIESDYPRGSQRHELLAQAVTPGTPLGDKLAVGRDGGIAASDSVRRNLMAAFAAQETDTQQVPDTKQVSEALFNSICDSSYAMPKVVALASNINNKRRVLAYISELPPHEYLKKAQMFADALDQQTRLGQFFAAPSNSGLFELTEVEVAQQAFWAKLSQNGEAFCEVLTQYSWPKTMAVTHNAVVSVLDHIATLPRENQVATFIDSLDDSIGLGQFLAAGDDRTQQLLLAKRQQFFNDHAAEIVEQASQNPAFCYRLLQSGIQLQQSQLEQLARVPRAKEQVLRHIATISDHGERVATFLQVFDNGTALGQFFAVPRQKRSTALTRGTLAMMIKTMSGLEILHVLHDSNFLADRRATLISALVKAGKQETVLATILETPNATQRGQYLSALANPQSPLARFFAVRYHFLADWRLQRKIAGAQQKHNGTSPEPASRSSFAAAISHILLWRRQQRCRDSVSESAARNDSIFNSSL